GDAQENQHAERELRGADPQDHLALVADAARQQVGDEQRADDQAQDALLVLGVGARGKPGAQPGKRALVSGGALCHQALAPVAAGSRHVFCTSTTSFCTAPKASTRRGSRCLPRCASRYSKACALFHAVLYGRAVVRAAYTSATATMGAHSGMWSPTSPFG